MEINDRITKVLEYSGFTASEFADEIDVQRSSISHIVSGRNKPSLEFMMKVKSRFPELSWDWLILGKGDLKQVQPTLPTTTESAQEPDLFTLVDEDYKNEIFMQEDRQNENQRKLNISAKPSVQENISDSQRLGILEDVSEVQNIVNENVNTQSTSNKIKKIVFFYENGKFEAFEP